MSERGDQMDARITESAETDQPARIQGRRRPRHRAVRPRASQPPRGRARGRLRRGGSVRLLRRLPRGSEHHAPDLSQPDHRAHRAFGVRQDDVHPLPESDERPHRGRARGGHAPVPRRRSVRRVRRPRRGPQADRHGVPEAEPVPQVDLRQHLVRSEDRWVQGQHGRPRRGVAAPCGAVGRGEGQAEGVRARALRRTAAAPVHRAGDRDQARRDPDGRALLGARPDRDAADRGPDAGAPDRLHDRDRDPQHAAGRTGLRPDGLLHRRGARRRPGSERERSSSTTETETIFTNPSDPRTEDYVTGRFG